MKEDSSAVLFLKFREVFVAFSCFPLFVEWHEISSVSPLECRDLQGFGSISCAHSRSSRRQQIFTMPLSLSFSLLLSLLFFALKENVHLTSSSCLIHPSDGVSNEEIEVSSPNSLSTPPHTFPLPFFFLSSFFLRPSRASSSGEEETPVAAPG